MSKVWKEAETASKVADAADAKLEIAKAKLQTVTEKVVRHVIAEVGPMPPNASYVGERRYHGKVHYGCCRLLYTDVDVIDAQASMTSRDFGYLRNVINSVLDGENNA